MLIPPQLWVPTEKDLRTTYAPVVYNRTAQSNTASASFGVLLPTPAADQVLIVSSILGRGLAGGVQEITQLIVRIVDAQAITREYARIWDSGVVAQGVAGDVTMGPGYAVNQGQPGKDIVASVQGQWYVMNGQTLSVFCTFSAGAVANNVLLWAHGILVPRGNFQYG